MKILVDTNVILDALLKREPYDNVAQTIITKCADGEVIGYLAAHSIPDLFYILRKNYSQKERRKFIRNPADYKTSRIKVIEPDEFIKLL